MASSWLKGPRCGPSSARTRAASSCARQEFLLFRVEETDNVVAFQDVVQILLVLQRNLPRCRRIDGIDFLAAGIIRRVVGRHVKDLALSVDRIEDDFFAQDDRVSSRSQFVERQNVEPRSFVAGRIKQYSHRVLFQQGGPPFVDDQIFVGFQMQ